MAIYDTMNYVKPAVSTICMGMAASMAAFLLSSGEGGKRLALPYSRVMIHQPLISGGLSGQASDIEIHARELIKTKQLMNEILAKNTGQSIKKIQEATDRDNFLSAQEAKDYGLVDDIIRSRAEIGDKHA